MIETPVLDPVEAYALWATEYPPWAHNPLMLAEERAMLRLLPADLRNRSVCDAGCGSGRYLQHAHRRGAATLIGLDLSEAMLRRARELARRMEQSEDSELKGGAAIKVARADLNALPLVSGRADVTVCGLTLGHMPDLDAPLAELRRVTHPEGRIFCSELHPAGQMRGWERTFKVEGRRYSVRHHWRTLVEWKAAFRRAHLAVVRTLEPLLDPKDIPSGAHFDAEALTIPVAVVFELRRDDGR